MASARTSARGPEKSHSLILLALFALLMSVATLYVPPRFDDLSIISTGLHILRTGEYKELFFQTSHRGPLAAVINGAAFLLTGSLKWSTAIVASAAAATTALGLLALARKVGYRRPWIGPMYFIAFPFLPYALNTSAVHMLQSALFVWSIVALFGVLDSPSVKNTVRFALLAGLGALTHPFSIVFASVFVLVGSATFLSSASIPLKRRVALLCGASAIILLCFSIQAVLVYSSSGRFALSAQSFEVLAEWNLRNPPLAGPSTSWQEISGHAAPQSPVGFLKAAFQNPGVYWDHFLRPAQRATLVFALNPLMCFFWLPWFSIGIFCARPSRRVLGHLALLLPFAVVTALFTTMTFATRYWIPCLVVTVPLVGRGVDRLAGWITEAAEAIRGAPTGLPGRLLVVGFLLLTAVAGLKASYHERTGANVVFDAGEFLAESAEAPPRGSIVYTTNGHLYLWAPDYSWNTSDGLLRDVREIREGSQVYALLHNRQACDIFHGLAITDEFCGESGQASRAEGVETQYEVVEEFARDRDRMLLVRFFVPAEPVPATERATDRVP